MDNLSAMGIFVKVVNEGSFSAAARAASLTPSAVSKQVGRLEDRLGARLFNRTTRHLSLTEVGKGFYERCCQILVDVEEAEDAVANLHAAPRGTLKINVPVAFGRLWITGLIPEFMTLYPEIKLDLNLQDRFVDLLSEGYDLAVRIGDLEDSSLIARKLAANRRVVCASPEYLKNHGAPKHPKDLESHDCLIYASRAFRNDWRFEGPDGEELVHVSGAVETNNPEVIMDLTCKNMGISLLPLWLVGPAIRKAHIVEVLPDYHVPDSAIYAIYPPGRHLSPKVRVFVDFMVEKFNLPENHFI